MHHKIQIAMVWGVLNLVFSPQQHYFVGHDKQIWPTPILVNLNKLKPYQLFVISRGPKMGVTKEERSQWTSGIGRGRLVKSGGWHTIKSRMSSGIFFDN